MLKLMLQICRLETVNPAAFRRLCVETTAKAVLPILGLPAAFRRLCVETLTVAHIV